MVSHSTRAVERYRYLLQNVDEFPDRLVCPVPDLVPGE
jgi:hypothetical protein